MYLVSAVESFVTKGSYVSARYIMYGLLFRGKVKLSRDLQNDKEESRAKKNTLDEA